MSVRSARADRYLEDLARMLDRLEPVQRADVLESVREHIDAALAELGHEPSEQEVIVVLNALGPPSEVAAQALEQQGSVVAGEAQTAAGAPLEPAPTLIGAWVSPVAVLSILLGSLFGVVVLPLILLVGGIVLVCASSLWSLGQKVAASVVAPLGILPFLPVSSLLAWQVQPSETGITAGSVVAPAALLVGVGVLIWVGVSGARESSRRRTPHGRPS